MRKETTTRQARYPISSAKGSCGRSIRRDHPEIRWITNRTRPEKHNVLEVDIRGAQRLKNGHCPVRGSLVRETGIEAYVGSTVTFQIPAGSDTTIRSSLDTAGMKIVRGVDKNGECIVGAPFTLLPYVEHGVSKTHRKNKKTVHTQPFLVKKGLLKRLPPGTRMTMPGIRRV